MSVLYYNGFSVICSWSVVFYFDFFFFKQKTAYEMRISDWSSDVCSSDLYHNSLIYGDGVSDVAVLGPGMIHGLGLRRAGPGPKWHGVKGWVSPKARGMDPHEARLSDPAERAEEGKGNKSLAFKNCRNVLQIGRASCRERVWQYV